MDEPTPLKVHYDEQFDTLEIFFQDPEPALTVELEEDVYVHIVPKTKQVVGLTIHNSRSHFRACSVRSVRGSHEI